MIHTVGPVYVKGEDRSHLLASAYQESLRVADELGTRTVAFPAVSPGIYGWPLDDAARIAVGTLCGAETGVAQGSFRAVRPGRLPSLRGGGGGAGGVNESTSGPSARTDLLVIAPVRDFTCANCGGTDDFLQMADAGPLCLTCADLDTLIFLPAGDAALTRRAKKVSTLSAVVVR